MQKRKVVKIIQGTKQIDGAGVKVNRIFANAVSKDFDPFLFLDVFDSKNPDDYTKGFPWHPHRGIETITYLIKGQIEHGDSIGNHGTISDGSCQWMTAGSGILHQEMPQPVQHMLGFQLWLNLPQKHKMTHPQYRDITAKTIPTINEKGATIKIISGRYQNTKGPVEGDYVKATILDVELKANTKWHFTTDNAETAFVYIFSGGAYFSPDKEKLIQSHNAILLNYDKELFIQADQEDTRLVVFVGKPLQEPIAWGGSIVMNTREEVVQAYEDLENNTFLPKNS